MLKDFYLSFSAVCFTLLALVDPDSSVLWRVSFAAAAIGGQSR